MTDTKTHVVTTTIGRDWMTDQLEAVQDAVLSQIGQAQHYLALCRTRDAQQHLRLVVQVLEAKHKALVREMFEL